MIVDPSNTDPGNLYKLLIGSITPRPIAFVSTVSKDGVNNLAPYSFFTGISSNPPVIGFSPVINLEGRLRDSRINSEAYEEFVVNIVSEDIAERMNATAVDVPPDVDEFELAGLTPAPCNIVRAPRVKESRVSMECKLLQVVEVSKEKLGGAFVMGEIVQFHIDDDLFDNYRIDPDKLNTVGRMGGSTYARTKDRFELERPNLDEVMAKLNRR